MLVSTLGYAWITKWRHVGWPALVALLVLALVAEALEVFAGTAGVKKAGGSKRGMIGGIVGGLLGALFLSVIPIPGIAQLVGAIIGTFVGVVVVELMLVGKHVDHSVQIGIGAAKGRFWGTVLKTLVGAIMFCVALVTAFPVERKAGQGAGATVSPPAGPATTPSPATLPSVEREPPP
jgi:uncharacterized protein YqgC (DUF456 family)